MKPGVYSQDDPEYKQFLAEHAYVLADRGDKIAVKTDTESGQRIDLIPTRSAKLAYSNVLVDNGRRKPVNVLTAGINSPHRVIYSGVKFFPEPGVHQTTKEMPKTRRLNLYLGLAVTPADGQCGRIKQHILEILCGGDEAKNAYALNWLADMVQNPGGRGKIALVINGGPGTGKTIIADIFREAFGTHATTISDVPPKTSTDWRLAASVFVLFENAHWSRRGVLKWLLTDRETRVDMKGFEVARWPNCAHVMVLSNNDWPYGTLVPEKTTYPRAMVLNVKDTHAGDRGYFQALAEEINSGGREAFINELLQRDTTGFNPHDLP